ncbi:Metallo-dependent phosphatase-like protein [Diaporthe sp. PMI_573]|nr:Metallo-dependent phosphatase-like protein [Diaporthaceae sp. PMI_573]
MSASSILDSLLPDEIISTSHLSLPLQIQSTDVQGLLEQSRNLLETGGNINYIRLGKTERLVVIGDLHGNVDNLCTIILREGKPSQCKKYLFNGDFVDRGPYSVETLLLIVSLKAIYPQYVFLNRGNHESDLKQSFYKELGDRFLDGAGAAYNKSIKLFRAMQIATVLSSGAGKAFIVHGGIPVSESQPVTLEDIARIERHIDPPRNEDHLLTQFLWNDPTHTSSNKGSQREGYGQRFDQNDTDKFLKANNFKVVFRSHQMITEGLREEHRSCYTVFSALDGGAQYVIIDDDLQAELKTAQVEIREEQWRYLY